MPLRQIEVPSLGRSLSAFMIAPSSAQRDIHEAGLEAFYRLGGNGIHLHGEGGETHSRLAVGAWLRPHRLRQEFFLCTQICHGAWDETTKQPIARFSPEAVQQDIDTDLQLLGVDYLDLVYLDDHPGLPFEPVIEAIQHEIVSRRVRALGVRNWTADRIRAVHRYATEVAGGGIATLVTTELSLFASTRPLWPEFVPFDATLRQVVGELGLAVLAHATDWTLGQCLFGDEEAMARLRPEWVQRWQHPANADRAQRVQEVARARGLTPRAIQIAWLLNQSFPVIAIVGLPSLLTATGAEYERGSQLRLETADLLRLNSSHSQSP
jgi:1-deoxyxylulose-5-phosphate synthase